MSDVKVTERSGRRRNDSDVVEKCEWCGSPELDDARFGVVGCWNPDCALFHDFDRKAWNSLQRAIRELKFELAAQKFKASQLESELAEERIKAADERRIAENALKVKEAAEARAEKWKKRANVAASNCDIRRTLLARWELEDAE